jgi:hypothetical protein
MHGPWQKSTKNCRSGWLKSSGARCHSLWLDSLASVRNISPDTNGTIKAVFDFKNGGETAASILQNNRVLYVSDLWHNEQLDLGSLTRIEFLN